MADFAIHLEAGVYQRDISALRNHLDLQGVLQKGGRSGYLTVALYPPNSDDFLELKVRCSDVYIVGFRGADQWYYLQGDKPEGADGSDTGVSGNYNSLGTVNNATADMFTAVLELKQYRKGAKLRGDLLVLVAAVVSEAVRFATVSTWFTGLFNGLLPYVPLAQLKDKYFLNWSSFTKAGNLDVLLQK
jgi:hypothetical protein